MPPIANYALHLLLAALLLIIFFIVYMRITPYDEVLLIRQGNNAAALPLPSCIRRITSNSWAGQPAPWWCRYWPMP
jgi:uncharacterized membrane protein YjfL (UPF0719 family)